MRSSVTYGNFWPTVFSVNDVPVVSLYDKGYSYIYLDRGIYKIAGGTHMHKDYLKFSMPIDAGGQYYIEYGQESTGYNTFRDRIRAVRIDEARAMIASYSHKPADPVELPNQRSFASSAEMYRVAELEHVKTLAERNNCKADGEPRLSIKPGSSSRLYDVACEGGGAKKFECGAALEGRSGQSCWLI